MLPSSTRRALELQPNFAIREFSMSVGVTPAVYTPFAEAWREAGMPAE